jgi:hypothetical protein
MNLQQKKKVEGQIHGQEGLFVTVTGLDWMSASPLDPTGL